MENFLLFEQYERSVVEEFKSMANTYLESIKDKYKITDSNVKTKFIKSKNTVLVDISLKQNNEIKVLHFALLPGSAPR